MNGIVHGACPICGSDNIGNWMSVPDRFYGRVRLYHLSRCATCSLVWTNDPPAPTQMAEHYGVDYHKAISTSGEKNSYIRWQKPRQRLFSISKGGALLDIGCSSGSFLSTLRGGPWELYGVEVSPNEAEKARLSSGGHISVCEFLDAPLTPSTFDVITCFHVLEHLHQPWEVMRRVWELLKPGGVFFVQCPNIESVEAYIFRSYWYPLELPRHLYHFSPKSLKVLATAMGFQDDLLITRAADCYVEKSFYYVTSALLNACKVPRRSLADLDGSIGLLQRILRKAFRMTVLWPFRNISAAAGRGAAIEAVFRKTLAIEAGQATFRTPS